MLHPSRAAECAALGTHLGTVPLVRLNEACPMPNGLVVEHRAKRRPARIQDRLRHLGAGQSRAVHVTHTDQGVFPDDAGGLLVQEVAPLGSDLPVYPARQRLAPGSLGSRQFGRRFADVTRVLDLLPAGKPGQRTEAEVNADFAVPRRNGIRDLANEIEIPAPFGALAKTTRPDVGWDRPRQPQPVFLTEEGHGIAVDLERPVALERHPSKGPLWATAHAPAWLPLRLVPADGELLTHGLHGIAVEPEFLATAAGELDQVEARRPAAGKPAAVVLDGAAVVPDLVDRPGHASEPLARRGILDAVSVRQQHGAILFGRRPPCKTSAESGTAFHGLLFTWSALPSTAGRCSMPGRWNGYKATSPRSARPWAATCWPVMVKPTTCTPLSSTHPRSPSRCWSTPSRAHPAACCEKSAPTSRAATSTACCGRLPTSPPRLAARPSTWSDSTWNSSGHPLRLETPCRAGARPAIPPRPKRRGFSRWSG